MSDAPYIECVRCGHGHKACYWDDATKAQAENDALRARIATLEGALTEPSDELVDAGAAALLEDWNPLFDDGAVYDEAVKATRTVLAAAARAVLGASTTPETCDG